jgi:hypothetical protein
VEDQDKIQTRGSPKKARKEVAAKPAKEEAVKPAKKEAAKPDFGPFFPAVRKKKK